MSAGVATLGADPSSTSLPHVSADDDLAIAMALQAEYDAEDSAFAQFDYDAAHSAGLEMFNDVVMTQEAPSGPTTEDAAYFESPYEELAGATSQERRKRLGLERFGNLLPVGHVMESTGRQLPPHVVGRLSRAAQVASAYSKHRKDKQSRAVAEGVLDEETRLAVFHWLSNKRVLAVDGVLSEGKEARVYAATLPDEDGAPRPGALKIYKPHRRKGSKKDAEKAAEREFKALHRMRMAGVACPEPVALRLNIVVRAAHAPRCVCCS